jgi:hypothetical protein
MLIKRLRVLSLKASEGQMRMVRVVYIRQDDVVVLGCDAV